MEDLKKDFDFGDKRLVNFVNVDRERALAVLTWRNHPDVRKWMFSDSEIGRDPHLAFLEGLKTDNKNFYWCMDGADGQGLGVISLNRVDFNNRNCYFGIYANPFLTVKGAGFFLMHAVKHLAFEAAGLHTLKLEVFAENEVAVKFNKFCGFREEGVLKEYVFRGGTYKDVIVMGLINGRK